MILIDNISAVNLKPCVASIGFFDGVHLGHRYLIEQVKEEAAKKGLASAIITFPVHPRVVMDSNYKPELLTYYEEKLELLSKTGIDYCIVLDFTIDISQLTAQRFMEVILKQKYNVNGLVIGHDHRFGHNRSEGFDDYCRFGKELDIDVVKAKVCIVDDTIISSSVIRRLLKSNEISLANTFLTYNYSLEGVVVGGHRIGRTLGFPTANLKIEKPYKLVPANGVYGVYVTVAGKKYAGMLDIGHRPTIANGNERSIEVHILHFNSNIYNFPIKLNFVEFIRHDIKFSSIEDLRKQLEKDAEGVEKLLKR
jgi:riboflavin kinase/FMN adenylyltransferase